MSIYSTAVKRPVTTLMVFMAVVVFGVFSLTNIPIDLYPELDPPIVTVFTTYSGANAADIETNITKPLEDNLSTISNLEEISSESYDNISLVTLEFKWESNLDEATNDIRDAISRIERFLPEDAEKPMIFKFSSNMIPILMLSATADESYPALEKILDDQIINPLNRVEGVGAVAIFGTPQRQVQINLDPNKLNAYQISLEQIGQVVGTENLNVPAGNMEIGQIEYPLRVEGEFDASDSLKNLIVGNFNGKSIYLKDIAQVEDTLKEFTIDERINGRRGVRIIVQKQSGANTVEIAKEINKIMPGLEKKLPPDVKIATIFDSSEFIINSINNLSNVLIYAGIFVVLVVLFFLGRWRATFIIILTIPVSLIVAFIYLYVADNTLNIVSLSSLSIAMGMVVDDAIVVLENITKQIERGSFPREGAIYGTNEVGLAVVATTLTVVAVFFPLSLLSGMTGIWFRPLGIIVTLTIVTSTLAALTLTPMLTSQLLKRQANNSKSLGGQLRRFNEKLLDRLDNFYVKTLRWCLRFKWFVILGGLAIFVSSLFLLKSIGTEFMPETDNGRIEATVELATGLRLEETAKISRQIEKMADERYPEMELISTSAGSSEDNIFSAMQNAGSNVINVSMRFVTVSERERSIFDIADDFREQIASYPEVITYSVTPGGSGGMGAESPIAIKIFGNDFDLTTQLAEELAAKVEKLQGTRDIEISRGDEKPELQVVFDRQKLAMLGLNTATAAQAVRNRIKGMTASRFREQGDEYDIVVKYDEKYTQSLSEIENIEVTTPLGSRVRIKDIAQIEEFYSPPNIERENRQRVLSVTMSLYQKSMGEVNAEIQDIINNMDVPSNVFIEVGGQIEEQQESFADLFSLLLLSILLVYIVMAAQFESFSEPFVIMFSIPFAFTGVMLALYFAGATLNVISFIGGIILVGIVVKNAIVMIDYTNLMRNRGLAITQAVLVAGRSRLRPVLMTTLTTLLAMLPLAISSGEGSEIWKPMGIAVIGGLTFSTAVTLILVPIIYTLFGKGKMKKHRKRFKQELALNGNNLSD